MFVHCQSRVDYKELEEIVKYEARKENEIHLYWVIGVSK